MSSLSRSNKQSYAILSDVNGNAVTVSGSSIRTLIEVALPAGTNTIGKVTISGFDSSVTIAGGRVAVSSFDSSLNISNVTPGTGAAHLGKTYDSAFATTGVGVASIAIRDINQTGGTTDMSYSMFRVDGSGSQYIKLVTVSASTFIGKVTVSGIDGCVGIAAGSKIGVTAIDTSVGINGVMPGTGATNLGKRGTDTFTSTDTGVASFAVVDVSLDTTLASNSYTALRVNKFGALHTTGTDNATTTKLMAWSDGLLNDGSFTSQGLSSFTDSSCYDVRSSRQFTIVGRARVAADVSVHLTIFSSSGPTHGIPDKDTSQGDMYNTGIVLLSDASGLFTGTYSDVAFPYFSIKNTGTTDACLNMTMYSR
jgi:hypothetical protein